jgi:hypothetical protein
MMAKGKKKGQGKLPKRIAGMKVPKALRRSGGQAAAWLASPTGRGIMASALVGAATLLAGDKNVRRAVKGSAGSAASGASRIGEALADTATDLMRRMAGGGEGETKPSKPAGTSPSSGRGRSAPTRPGEPGIAH